RNVAPDLCEACLSRQERAWLMNQRDLSLGRAFLHLWTLKEAVIKATGMGLQAELKAFTVLPFPPRIVEASPELGSDRRWELRQWTTPEGFIVALARRERINV
ncbi:4'-phosphopantetheinyl transferase family protein, partial [Peribacillus frigoritolerans]|uniref:4'-phosphopantetheinyl transferase family protein n=1 Tax=Peribacillus frigoritolerans TaxID=450367 RepID=UPI0035D13778